MKPKYYTYADGGELFKVYEDQSWVYFYNGKWHDSPSMREKWADDPYYTEISEEDAFLIIIMVSS